MDIIKQFGDSFEQKWQQFVVDQQLSEKQSEQFAQYMVLLRQVNEQMNLTTIIKPENIVAHHFQDSLALGEFIDLNKVTGLCDIGSGGGFPGIPLKIMYPHLKLFLIEVNTKKIRFLNRVLQEIGLKGYEVYPYDWRTFLRKTDYKIDIFCARASLPQEELLRVFKPSSPYKNAQLVYWASDFWEPDKQVQHFVRKQEMYKIKKKKRKLVFMSLSADQ